MRRLFLCTFVTVFTIIGSVIGAGFITGKEVFEFFAKDLSLGGIYLAFLCFTFMIYLIMNCGDGGVNKSMQIFVAIANVIIAGCMVSALNSMYGRIFHLSEKVKILPIISAILILIISINGIGIVEKLCSVTLPFVVVIILILCAFKSEEYAIAISPKAYGGILKPVIYVGFNVVLSAGIIKNSGEKLSPPFKILASLITSFVLCLCIYMLSIAVKKEGYISEMPFVSLFNGNKKLLIIIDIITLFAIYSTLASSLYTINNFGGIKLNLSVKMCLFILVIAISRLDFSTIVERAYPTLGVIAYVIITVNSLLSRAFPKGQREHTLRQLKDTV